MFCIPFCHCQLGLNIVNGEKVSCFVSNHLAARHGHSKQLFTGHLYDACAKTSDIVIKIIMSAPGIEIIIVFLICYLQSLYEIELDHYFCPEFVGHVTNQNILGDTEKLM